VNRNVTLPEGRSRRTGGMMRQRKVQVTGDEQMVDPHTDAPVLRSVHRPRGLAWSRDGRN
jgi:hypothetical protein